MFNINTISLYIHIPWCINKCSFCDLYSIKNQEKLHYIYIKNLILDLLQNLIWLTNKKIISIYIGGGTPSLLSIENLLKLFNYLHNLIDFNSIKEITIEINPADLTLEKLQIYKQLGINRISLGIQTFNHNILQKINRYNNNIERNRLSLDLLNKYNFKNFNIDLIYGLPNQTYDIAINDLTTAIYYQPKHLSWYQLIDKHYNMNQTDLFNIYITGNKILKYNNYLNYEVSSYCKFNFFCKHNINYWQYGDYLGIGLNAHSKITLPNLKIIRLEKQHSIKKYLAKTYLKKLYFISGTDIILEYFINRLRLYNKLYFKELYGFNDKHKKLIFHIFKKLIKHNYIIHHNNYYKLSGLGKLYLNDVINYFNL